MRILSEGFLALVVWALWANLASAVVTVNLVIDAPNTSGTIVGNTVSDLVFGDTIIVLVEVDNTADADEIESLFTTIQFDANKLSLVSGENFPQILDTGIFPNRFLRVGTQPEQVFGQPAGNIVALSFMRFAGTTPAPGPEFATELVFTVIGHGTSNILQIHGPGDQSLVSFFTNDVDASPELVFGPPLTVVVSDQDRDSVLDSMDNCLARPNGPNEDSNQVDTDQDGYGNPCDPDFNQDGVTASADFAAIVTNFNTASELHDMNGNGVVDPSDFRAMVSYFGQGPGPSGLACAFALIDIAAGDPPCVP